MEEAIRWNYTTWLDIVFLIVALLLTVRFLRTGGPAMLRMMSEPAEHGGAHHDHGPHSHH
jgi:hypothetical protein